VSGLVVESVLKNSTNTAPCHSEAPVFGPKNPEDISPCVATAGITRAVALPPVYFLKRMRITAAFYCKDDFYWANILGILQPQKPGLSE